jgi:hypothetical protein
MVYAWIFPGPLLEQSAPQLRAYRNRPLGSVVTDAVPVTAGKGDPGMELKELFADMLNPVMPPGTTSAT